MSILLVIHILISLTVITGASTILALPAVNKYTIMARRVAWTSLVGSATSGLILVALGGRLTHFCMAIFVVTGLVVASEVVYRKRLKLALIKTAVE